MIELKEIEMEIKKLEQGETTFSACSKLADLYAVRNNLSKPAAYSNYSYGQSEFLQACSYAPVDGVLSVLDEHMEAIELLHPKEYAALIKKIKSL